MKRKLTSIGLVLLVVLMSVSIAEARTYRSYDSNIYNTGSRSYSRGYTDGYFDGYSDGYHTRSSTSSRMDYDDTFGPRYIRYIRKPLYYGKTDFRNTYRYGYTRYSPTYGYSRSYYNY